MMDISEIVAQLQSLGNETNREGMARFGIKTERALGISMSTLRQIARRIGPNNHALPLGYTLLISINKRLQLPKRYN